MRRLLLLFACCLFGLFIAAQSPWSVEAELGIGLSGNNDQEQTFGSLNSTTAYTDTWQERLVPTWNVGFTLNYALNRHWQLSAGLGLKQVGAQAELSRVEQYWESSLQISQSRHLRLRQYQLAAQISARYALLDGRNRAQPFILFGGQTIRLLAQGIALENDFDGRGPRARDIFTRDEIPAELQNIQLNPWGMNFFMGFGVRLNQFSIHLQYDWQAFPQGSLFYTDRGLYLPSCYTCQFVERSTQPLLRQTSLRLSYRIF